MTEDVGEHKGTWVAHRGAALVLRTVIFLIPVVLSVLGTAVISRALPPPSSTAILILWWVLLSIAATSILYLTDKAARQLLPLHALLNLFLIFPDRAPSRFKAALRSPGVRQLERRIADVKANGLGDSETEAAESLVELIGALAHHDRLTRGHAERVRAYSRMIGEEMGLDDDAINKLSWAGLMHDVGKLYVPSEILNKAGTLTADEFEIIKIHPAAGAELVEPLKDWLGDWVKAVGEHHERWDGGGYPAGLVGEEIALGARIVAVADAFDVLTSARSYKSPSSAAAARAEIQRCAGTQFDATVVRAFLNISVGRFRMVMGPLSWIAQAPIVGVPVAPAIGAMAGGFATAAGLLVGGFFQPPAIDSGPASVIAAPAVVAPADPTVITSATTSSSTTSTSTTSTSTTSTTAPPTAPAPTPSTTTTTIIEFFPDTFETPSVPAPFQPPVVLDDTFDGAEDTASIIAPLANDGAGLAIVSVTQPSAGTVTIRLDSTVRFDPPSNWWGTTSFTYVAQDSRGLTSTAKVTIDYRNVPDAPQTQNDWLIRPEDSAPATIDVTANDSDADLHGIRVTSIARVPSASPSLGTASITSSGLVRFAPNPNAFGNDIYVYFVQDPDGLTASGLLTVSLTPVNDPPVARNDVGSMNEDTVKTFSVRSNDYDVDGGPLTTTSATSAYGSASTNGTTVTYRPAPNSFGTQTVTYTISDGRGGTASAVLTINVAPVNDPPVARNDNGSMTEDDPTRVFAVLGNDTDIDGGPLSITSASSAFGTATTNGSTVSYRPNPQGNGIHTVSYTISDGRGGTDSATLRINVAAVNDPPSFTAGGDDTVAEDWGPRSANGWATNISAGPLDELGQTLTFNVTADDPTLFSVQPAINATTGTLTYTPAPDANGITTISVTLTDSGGATSAPQTAEIVIIAVNDDPSFTVGGDDTVAEDSGPQTVTGWATDISAGPANESTQTVTFNVTSDNPGLFSTQPAVTPTGTLTYTPTPNGNGTANLSVAITDSRGATSAAQTATIEVTPVNDPPTFTVGGDDTVAEDSGPRSANGWATNISAGPLDELGQTLTFNVTADDPALFSVQPAINATTGTLTYTPAPDANGITTISVTLSDSEGATTAPQTADIVIIAVNDDPSFTVGGDDTVAEDSGPQTVTGWATDISAGPANESAQTVTFDVTADDPTLFSAQPAVDEATGDLTYTPGPNENGTATLTVTLIDSRGGTSAPQTATIEVTPVNDPPSFTAGADEVVAEDSGPQIVAAWATGMSPGPANESTQTLTFDVTADDPTLFSVQPAVDEVTGDLTYTPGPNENGTATLTITLSDSAGGTSPAQFADITISALNDSPVLDPIGDKSGDELTVIGFTATATDSDLPPDTLTYSLTGQPSGATINPTSGVFSWTPTEAQGPGAFTFDVTVTDDGTPVGSDTETITITVAEVNLAPTIDIAAGATVGNGKAIDLTPALLAASDPDLPAQSLSYILEVAPTNGDVERTGTPIAQGATFTEAEIAAGDIAYRHNGSSTTTDTFEITASDGAGGVSTAASFPITVAVVSPTPITIGEIRTDSQSGRDFVELYNGSYRDIDLGAENWTLVIEDLNGAALETVTLTGTFPINATALIVEAGYTGFGTPDATATIATFPRGAGFSVRKAAVEIDAVGTSSGSSFAEGTPLPRMGGTLDQAYVRRNGWGRGACVDTDDNAADFTHMWALFASTPTGIADGLRFPCLGPAPAPPAPPPANHPVIREYRTDGPGGGSDEFVEIFNPGPDRVMTGWTVELNKPPFEYVYIFPAGYVLESGRHFLLAGSGYTGAATPDAPTAVGITNGTGVFLWGPSGGRIDTLGIETGSQWYEPNLGVGLPRIDGRTYHSFERRNNGCTDTNNNFYDFEHHLGFDTPTNNSAGVFPCV